MAGRRCCAASLLLRQWLADFETFRQVTEKGEAFFGQHAGQPMSRGRQDSLSRRSLGGGGELSLPATWRSFTWPEGMPCKHGLGAVVTIISLRIESCFNTICSCDVPNHYFFELEKLRPARAIYFGGKRPINEPSFPIRFDETRSRAAFATLPSSLSFCLRIASTRQADAASRRAKGGVVFQQLLFSAGYWMLNVQC